MNSTKSPVIAVIEAVIDLTTDESEVLDYQTRAWVAESALVAIWHTLPGEHRALVLAEIRAAAREHGIKLPG